LNTSGKVCVGRILFEVSIGEKTAVDLELAAGTEIALVSEWM